MQIRTNQRNNRREDSESAMSFELVWERLCSRMGNLGTYRLLQVNGQRKFFDPLDDSPPMGEGCEVFIGRIPKDMFEDELVPLFALYGPIHEMRLMMNFSGLNRGFAFLMYKQPQYAEQAIRKLNDFEVRPGQFIGVIHSVNNRRLYIGKFNPSNINESNLAKLLSTLTEGLQSVSLHAIKKVGEKVPRRYAVAVYVSHRHAAMARRYLILRKNEIFQNHVVVDWASPNIRIDNTNGHEHSPAPAPALCENNGNPRLASSSKAELPEATFQHPGPPDQAPPEEVFKKEKTSRPIHLLRRHPKNEKFVGHSHNASKGICYTRLTTPLYSLSPVPKPNSLVHLRPPSLRVPRGNGTGAAVCSYPPDSENQRPKEAKGKRGRKPIQRFPPMIPLVQPGQA